MKIRFLVAMAGPGVSHAPGDIADIDDAEAERLVGAGFAAPVDAAPVDAAPAVIRREKAVKPASDVR